MNFLKRVLSSLCDLICENNLTDEYFHLFRVRSKINFGELKFQNIDMLSVSLLLSQIQSDFHLFRTISLLLGINCFPESNLGYFIVIERIKSMIGSIRTLTKHQDNAQQTNVKRSAWKLLCSNLD